MKSIGDRAFDGVGAASVAFLAMDEGARDEIGQLLAEVANRALAAQQGAVPVDTGYLGAQLEAQVQIEQLRARIGILGRKALSASSRRKSRKLGGAELWNLGAAFYGRPVDRGIAAQTVTVQRRRRVAGRLRTSRRRKIAADIVVTYALNVKARPGTYFIEHPDLDTLVDGRLDAFWDALDNRWSAAA